MRIIRTYIFNSVIILLICIKVSNSSIPRSTRNYNYHDSYSSVSYHNNPPWNPSSKIDNEGFLNEYYRCIPGEWEDEISSGDEELLLVNTRKKYKIPSIVQIRQVPGDGNCLFHSIATCLSLAENKTHFKVLDGDYLSILSYTSKKLRQEAVNCLSCRPRRPLFIQGNEYLRAYDLVQAAASQYNLTGSKYCELMRKESYWGGGPEIVALCNVLRRPIYVYELVASHNVNTNTLRGGSIATCEENSVNTGFCLRRMACFGSPKFNRRDAIHILSADSRFPDVTPGKQLQNGNHFLALFPAKMGHNLDLKGGASDGHRLGRERNNVKLRKKIEKDIVHENVEVCNNVLVAWFGKIRKLLTQMPFSGAK